MSKVLPPQLNYLGTLLNKVFRVFELFKLGQIRDMEKIISAPLVRQRCKKNVFYTEHTKNN